MPSWSASEIQIELFRAQLGTGISCTPTQRLQDARLVLLLADQTQSGTDMVHLPYSK